MRPRRSCFCSSLPYMMMIGPIMETPEPPGEGTRASASSSLKMNCSPGLMPPPPYSFGQCGAIQPRSTSAWRQPVFWMRSSASYMSASGAPLGKCSLTTERTSPRNAASSGLSRKSTALRSFQSLAGQRAMGNRVTRSRLPIARCRLLPIYVPLNLNRRGDALGCGAAFVVDGDGALRLFALVGRDGERVVHADRRDLDAAADFLDQALDLCLEIVLACPDASCRQRAA